MHVDFTPVDTHRLACNQCSERCRSRHRKFQMKPNGNRRKWMQRNQWPWKRASELWQCVADQERTNFLPPQLETEWRDETQRSPGPKGRCPKRAEAEAVQHDNTDPTLLSHRSWNDDAPSEECHEERMKVAPATRRWQCQQEKPLGNAPSSISPARIEKMWTAERDTPAATGRDS